MKKMLLFLLGAAWMAAAAAPASPAPDLIARIHFAGAGQIAADTNAAAFTNLWCSPEALALRGQTLDKLSRAPYAWFKSKMPPGAGDGAARLRPLLDDLLSAEWFLQIRDGANGSPEYALAIHLDADHALPWDVNLKTILQSWTQLPAQKSRIAGQVCWRLEKHEPPNLICCAYVGDWVVLGCGQNELPLSEEMVRRILAEKRPGPVETNVWLAVDLDWPRLARWYAWLPLLDLPEIRLQGVGRNRDLRLDGKLIFPQPLALNLEPWRMPTNTVRQPFISFTAMRGIAPWLEKQDWARPYEIAPVPNQVFIWAMAETPLQTFAAVPVPDANKAVEELGRKLSARTNWQNCFTMPLTMKVTNNSIGWAGLPYVAPNLAAWRESSNDFLFASLFPNSPKREPLPPELFTLLGQTNLVYYHWEITAERLRLLPQLSQLVLMATGHRQFDMQSAAGKWLDRVGPMLGNSVTRITWTAPNELTFLRIAPGGLNALELAALANWLEAPNFPGCDLRLPPRPQFKRPPHKTSETNSAPAPAIPKPPAMP